MTKDEALKLALEALDCICSPLHVREITKVGNAMKAIKETLAQPEQEPVAWNVVDPTGKIVATEMNSVRGWARIEGYKPTVEGLLGFHEQGWRVVPTTPPQREWVGLTDEEIDRLNFTQVGGCQCSFGYIEGIEEFARAIEAKLRKENGC